MYSHHKWKKLPGILYVTVKKTVYSKNGSEIPRAGSKMHEPSALEKTKVSPGGSVPKESRPEMKLTKWSRLPTQSCKIPNHVSKIINVGRKGGSYVRFGRVGRHVAVASLSRIFVYDVLSGEEVADLNGHNGLVYELDWSPEDDKFLLSASGDCTAAVWSISSKTPLYLLPHPSFVYCGKWLGSSEELLTGGKDHVVRRWRKRGDAFELIEEMGGYHGFITSLAVSGDSVFFSGDSQGCVTIRKRCQDSEGWILMKKITFEDTLQKAAVDAIHVHPGGRRILLTLRGKGSFAVDLIAGVVLQNYKAMVNVCARSISCLTPCGSFVYFFCQNGELNVWEVDTGKLSAVYENLFPADSLTELGSCIDYHPFEHLMAFTVLGQNYPAYVLSYEGGSPKKDDSKTLGLILIKNLEVKWKTNSADVESEGPNNKEPLLSLSSIKPDKLRSIVQKMDQTLTINRSQNHFSY